MPHVNICPTWYLCKFWVHLSSSWGKQLEVINVVHWSCTEVPVIGFHDSVHCCPWGESRFFIITHGPVKILLSPSFLTQVFGRRGSCQLALYPQRSPGHSCAEGKEWIHMLLLRMGQKQLSARLESLQLTGLSLRSHIPSAHRAEIHSQGITSTLWIEVVYHWEETLISHPFGNLFITKN